MQPSIGRIVHYKLSADDVLHAIARRLALSEESPWGGNPLAPGDVLPLVVCRVFPDEHGEGVPGVNGQVLLDGNDSLWVTSRKEGDGLGEWSWPPRT